MLSSNPLRRLTTAVPEHLYHRQERPNEDADLALQWTGTAGFRLVHQGYHFWLDPHFSRHSPWQVLRPISPDLDKIAAMVDRADAVAVGHSHFDHALDAPAIAVAHGAHVYGSTDTLTWCRGYGVPELQLHTLLGEGEVHDAGPFRLRAVKSDHSPFALGRVPFPGRIQAPIATPARVDAWRVGEVFGLHLTAGRHRVYHLGSAGLREAELHGIQADVVLCCTVGRQATPNFTQRMVQALRPRLVIPCHWDQFWRPIDAPARQIPGNDLLGFLDEVAACPDAPEVRILPMLGWTEL